MAFITLEIDNWRHTASHNATETMIGKTADVITRIVGDAGLVGRYKRASFLIVLPQTSGRQAYDMAETLRVAVSAQPFMFRHAHEPACYPLPITTISLGVAAFNVKNLPLADSPLLVAAAEQALAKAEKQGGNCTVVDPQSVGLDALLRLNLLLQQARRLPQMLERPPKSKARRSRT